MSPLRSGWYARATSSMYSAPRSLAIASWTGRGSGRVTRRIVRPSAAPPVAAAAPSSPASASSRRRDGSVGADICWTDQMARSATARQTSPVIEAEHRAACEPDRERDEPADQHERDDDRDPAGSHTTQFLAPNGWGS